MAELALLQARPGLQVVLLQQSAAAAAQAVHLHHFHVQVVLQCKSKEEHFRCMPETHEGRWKRHAPAQVGVGVVADSSQTSPMSQVATVMSEQHGSPSPLQFADGSEPP